MSYASKRRQSSSEDEGGGANWMDTYGDLVTLLLCFFVMLFAFSSVDAGKWEALVISFGGSPAAMPIQALDMPAVLENPVEQIITGQSNDSDDGEVNEDTGVSQYDALSLMYNSVQSFIDDTGLGAEVIPNFETYVLIIRFKDSIFFEPGEATILPEMQQMLDRMVDLFESTDELYKMIRIEGHTDTVPIHNEKFADNWALSTGRAESALRYILAHGRIDNTKLSLAGFGEFQPVDTNDTAEGRASNRRVDFVIEV